MTQHASLSPERWARFSTDQQILMIGNEMQRASSLLAASAEVESIRRCYERVLRLVDLTVGGTARRGLRRELLRWRDLVAELFLSDTPDETSHREAFRALLFLKPVSARQIPHLLV